MFKVATPPKNSSAAVTPPVPRDKVAQRAYEKWCQRGRAHGSDVQDWLEAERELRAEMARHAKAPARR